MEGGKGVGTRTMVFFHSQSPPRFRGPVFFLSTDERGNNNTGTELVRRISQHDGINYCCIKGTPFDGKANIRNHAVVVVVVCLVDNSATDTAAAAAVACRTQRCEVHKRLNGVGEKHVNI